MTRPSDSTPGAFADALRAFMERERRTNSDLAQLTGISVRTIEKWAAGEARRPRFVADLLKVGRGLALSLDETDALLHAAGHPGVAKLTAQGEQTGDATLLALLDRWRPSAATGRAGQASLHQLRAPVVDFVGREQERAVLLAALAVAAGPPPAGCAVGLHGMGGVGKTELATRAAHDALALFPDAQLVVELHGASEAPVSSTEALRQLVRALDPDGAAVISDDLGELQRRYLTLLHGRRVLVLADDARDVEQVRALMPPAGCGLLITSRQRFTLPGMVGVHLEPLDGEAPGLLRQICARLDSAEAAALARACAGLPLALRVSAGLLQNNPAMRPGHYVARLDDLRQRLRQLSDPDDPRHDVAASLALSYDLLDAPARRIFRQLGVLAGDFDLALAAAAAGVAEGEAEPALHLLLRRNLLRYDGARERWGCHDLVRALALEQLAAAGEEEAVGLRYARAACRIGEETQAGFLGGGDAGMAALARFDAERPHTDAAWRWALARAGAATADRLLIDLALATDRIGRLRYHPADEVLPRLAAAQAAAERLGDAAHVARLQRMTGTVLWLLGEPQRALPALEQALHSAQALGDEQLEAEALRDLASSVNNLGGRANIETAIGYEERALAIFRARGDEFACCMLLNNIGTSYASINAFPQAAVALEEALAIARARGFLASETALLSNLGWIYTEMGQLDRAIGPYEQALAITRALQDPRGSGYVLGALAHCCLLMGDLKRAIAACAEAVAVLNRIGDARGVAICSWTYGKALLRSGERERGLALMRETVDYERRVGYTEEAEHAAELAALEAEPAAPGPDAQ